MGEPSPHAHHHHRVLIVDDTPDITDLFGTLLRRAGYRVETASSAAAALTAARGERFDLIIADLGMPGVNGYDFAAQLRTLHSYRDIPLVAVTGFAEYGDRQQALNAGYNEHLSKPVDLDQLLELVAHLLNEQD